MAAMKAGRLRRHKALNSGMRQTAGQGNIVLPFTDRRE
jgi:hypothetical protein